MMPEESILNPLFPGSIKKPAVLAPVDSFGLPVRVYEFALEIFRNILKKPANSRFEPFDILLKSAGSSHFINSLPIQDQPENYRFSMFSFYDFSNDGNVVTEAISHDLLNKRMNCLSSL